MTDTGKSEILPSDSGTFIKIDERAYRYIRQFSIKNVTDAIVELLTNSDDAYGRGSFNPPKKFFIQYHEKYKTICVIDNATGLRADQMIKCFMQVGSYTSTEDSRGFFSRGAKDVSILGDVFFESIKDGFYSKTFITANAYAGVLVTDQAVTTEDRDRLQIGFGSNGLSVRIQLLPTYYINNIRQQMSDITKRATLRGILSDTTNCVKFQYFDADNSLVLDEQLIYTFPPGKILLDLVYEVANYPGIMAQFTVYKATDPIAQPAKDSELEYGFLTQSGTSIHEVSTIDNRFKWHPYMNLLFGTLKCDHINYLLKQLDSDGITMSNPTTVIDPSRYAGLNREHPFIESLLRVPKVRLDYILRQLDRDASKKSVQMNELNEILEQLEDLSMNIFENIPTKQEWIETYETKLIKAIQSDRQKYVNVERNFMLENSDIIFNTDKIVLSDLSGSIKSDTQSYVYMMNNDGGIVEIPTDIKNISADMTAEEIKQFYDYVIQYIQPENFSQHPYIYQMTESGDLIKLFVFSQGQLGDITTDELKSVKHERKILNIQFTKDINMKYRYMISMANGKIDITISLSDPVVEKYLLASKVNPDGTINDSDVTFQMTSLENVSNNKSYIFLGEMFIEIFARIILYGKTLNGNVAFTSADTTDMLRTIDAHYEETAAQIQVPITNIFNNYYTNNSVKLINTFMTTITQAFQALQPDPSALLDPTVLDSVKENLLNNYKYLF